MKQRRVAIKEWYETEMTKTGWDSNGWFWEDTGDVITPDWEIETILDEDKHYHPIKATFIKDIQS